MYVSFFDMTEFLKVFLFQECLPALLYSRLSPKNTSARFNFDGIELYKFISNTIFGFKNILGYRLALTK
jgi:hypothetical protein